MLTPLEEQAAAGAHEQWCRGQAQAIEDKLRVEWQAQVEELKSAASGPWCGVEAVWWHLTRVLCRPISAWGDHNGRKESSDAECNAERGY